MTTSADISWWDGARTGILKNSRHLTRVKTHVNKTLLNYDDSHFTTNFLLSRDHLAYMTCDTGERRCIATYATAFWDMGYRVTMNLQGITNRALKVAIALSENSHIFRNLIRSNILYCGSWCPDNWLLILYWALWRLWTKSCYGHFLPFLIGTWEGTDLTPRRSVSKQVMLLWDDSNVSWDDQRMHA